MPVIRTLEQLRTRRHAFLALPPDPIHERKIQRVDPAQEVGWLSVEVRGKKRHSLVITLGQDFWIGRHPDCDLVLKEPMISNFHLRIYAVRTSCQQSLICIHDLSTNGFVLNDLEYKPGIIVEVDNKPYSPRTVVLRPDDRIRFPDSSVEFLVHYFPRHIQPTQNSLPAGQVRCHIQPLFPSSDSSLTRELEDKWLIHNFTLGTGSFGRVHLATHKKQSILQAACKTVGTQADIGIEVQIISSITHPNVCGIYDMIKEEEADLIHLVMPLVTGGDLFSYMEKHQRLTEDEAKFAALQIIRAVDHLHAMSIAHRDIKPENILLHKSGAFPHLLLADFGLATTYQRVLAEVPADRTKPLARHPGFTGTVTYLPPERLKVVLSRKRTLGGSGESVHGGVLKWREEMGRKFFDEEKHIDIWAVGAVLYLILTGVHPYDNRNDPNASINDDTDQPFSESQPKQSYLKLSSARSWDAFRSSNRLGTLGDGPVTEQELEWRRVEERCSRFLKLGLNHWRPAERWSEISDEGIQLIAGLLHQHPIKRILMPQALAHQWFTAQQEDLDTMYKTVVIDGKLGRSPIWGFNNGVPPRRREASPPPHKIHQAIESSDHLPANTSNQLSKGKKSIPKPKGASITSSNKDKAKAGTNSKKKSSPKSSKNTTTSPTSNTLTDIPGSRSKPKKSSVALPITPTPPTPIIPRRTSSLFLPNSGIFGPLDDIAEADEDVDMADTEANVERREAAMTLHDLMDSPSKKQREGSGSGGSEETRVGPDGDVEMESHPPVQAGKRKVQIGKAGKGKAKVVLETQDVQQDEELRPSDLVNTLNVGFPTLAIASSSKPPANGITPPIRKSSFVPPVKKAEPGVVLARIGQGKA